MMNLNLLLIKSRIKCGEIFRSVLWKFGCDWLLWKKERFIEYPWVVANIGEGKNQKILDIGVGSSIFPLQIASLGHNVYALDLEDTRSEDMKKFACGIPSYHFIKADATALPFKSETFDNILFISSLEHISFPEKAITEAKRVLKSNGSLLVTLPYGKKVNKVKIDFCLYNKNLIKDLFKDSGLKLKKIYYFVKNNDNWICSNEKESEGTISNFVVKSIVCLRLGKEE